MKRDLICANIEQAIKNPCENTTETPMPCLPCNALKLEAALEFMAVLCN